MNAFRLFLAVLIAASADGSAFAQAEAAGLTRIGAAGAVQGSVKAAAPNAVGRVIESGKTLYLNDHVTTGSGGHLQVLLLDETVFTLGANADMVLDTFVYDPATGAGKVSAQITKGAFRFVTGQVARMHPQNMRVGLAVGTIGVRGTVVMGETGKDGSTVINAGAGPQNDADEKFSAVIVSNAGTKREVDTTGEGVTIKPGQAPSFPTSMTAEIQRISRLIQPPPPPQPAQNDPGPHRVGRDSGLLIADAKALAIDANQRGQYTDGLTAQTLWAFQNNNNLDDQSSGSSVPNGNTDWSQIQAIPSGSATYSGSGTSTCTNCVVSNPAVNFSIAVNFSSEQIGGGASIINMTGVTNTASTVTSAPIQATSYSALSGNANYAPTFGAITNNTSPAGSFTGPSPSFTPTTIQLVNSGGVAAKQMTMNLLFSNTQGVSLSGTITGSR